MEPPSHLLYILIVASTVYSRQLDRLTRFKVCLVVKSKAWNIILAISIAALRPGVAPSHGPADKWRRVGQARLEGRSLPRWQKSYRTVIAAWAQQSLDTTKLQTQKHHLKTILNGGWWWIITRHKARGWSWIDRWCWIQGLLNPCSTHHDVAPQHRRELRWKLLELRQTGNFSSNPPLHWHNFWTNYLI